MAEEECAWVDDVRADDFHLVGPYVPVSDSFVNLDRRGGVLGRVVIDVFSCDGYTEYVTVELIL